MMTQYFIGITKRSEKLVFGLLDLGATLMFKYHPMTLRLNTVLGDHDEWFLYTDVCPDFGIEEVERFLKNELDVLEYSIVKCLDK